MAKQIQNYTSAPTLLNLNLNVTITRFRPTGETDRLVRNIPIQKGDLNALCLNFGGVSKQMLEPLAKGIWNIERDIKRTPSLTNSLTVEDYQGPLVYLMGMAYYEKTSFSLPQRRRCYSLQQANLSGPPSISPYRHA